VVRLCVLALLLSACTVGDRYVLAPETWSAVTALPKPERWHTAAPARRQMGDVIANVRVSELSEREAIVRPDGEVAVPSRSYSRKILIGSTLVWIGTPLSIAGLLMTILGHGHTIDVRWAGIPIAAGAEPIMISGTVLWVQGARAHPQELPRGLADISYLPTPGVAPGSR
jgi:hypothetical protein